MGRKEVKSHVERVSGADLPGHGVVPPAGPGILEQTSKTKRLSVKVVHKHSFVIFEKRIDIFGTVRLVNGTSLNHRQRK
jgi:hypothetical protein